jgi:hypothetical protein
MIAQVVRLLFLSKDSDIATVKIIFILCSHSLFCFCLFVCLSVCFDFAWKLFTMRIEKKKHFSRKYGKEERQRFYHSLHHRTLMWSMSTYYFSHSIFSLSIYPSIYLCFLKLVISKFVQNTNKSCFVELLSLFTYSFFNNFYRSIIIRLVEINSNKIESYLSIW